MHAVLARLGNFSAEIDSRWGVGLDGWALQFLTKLSKPNCSHWARESPTPAELSSMGREGESRYSEPLH